MQVGQRVMVKVSDVKSRAGILTEIGPVCSFVKYDMVDEETKVYNETVTPFEEYPKIVPGTATKHDSGKNRLELIPISGIEGVGRAMTFGAKKYADHNWANGFSYSRLCGSAMRHMFAWMKGIKKDEESGLSHLDHLGACVLMLIAHETEGLGNDDRRKTTY